MIQARISDFFNNPLNLVQSLSQGESSAGAAAREQLISDVFSVLQRNTEPVGCSARAIALRLCQGSTTTSGLEEWVQAVLDALEALGYAYTTYDRSHFLATTTSSLPPLGAVAQKAFPPPQFIPLRMCPNCHENPIVVGMDDPPGSSGHDLVGMCPRPRQHGHRKEPADWIAGLQCRGRMSKSMLEGLWSRSLNISSKACALSRGQIFGSAGSFRGDAIHFVEFSATSEYILCGSGNGLLTVSKTSKLDLNLRDGWEEAARVQVPLPARQVRSGRSVDVVHWSAGNRNEIGIASKSNGDVILYDLKCCGTSITSSNSPCAVLTPRQGQGVGGILDFLVVEGTKLVLGGSQSGVVVIWDRRDGKKPKSTIRQSAGGVCYLQVPPIVVAAIIRVLTYQSVF